MKKDEEERYFIDGVTKQETGTESYKTVTGKEILIEDGENNKGLEIKVKGSTTQVTRSGKNKLPYNYYNGNSKTTNGITFTVNKDRSITANGTATANAQFSITNPDNYAIVAGSYKLVGENNTYTKKAIRGSYKKADGTIKYISSDSSFTIPEGATNVHLYVVILQGETVNNVTFYPMLLNLTETDLTFEAGGASPDYPSPIENVEGKNKFDINQEKEVFGIMLYKYSYYLKPNTKYTISSNCPASTTANIYANSNSSKSAVYINKNQTIQSDENGYFYILVRFKADASDNSTFNLYEKILNGTYYIQLEEGTVASPCVPHNSLEIKDVGENLFDKKNNTILTWLTAAEITEEGSVCSKNFIPTTKNKIYATNFAACVFYYDKKLNYLGNSMDLRTDNGNLYTTWTNPDNNSIAFMKVEYRKTLNHNLDMTTQEIMLTESETVKVYKPHQEQKVDFPLSEGQKLYEGSYLASDGIHHKRTQVVLDGSKYENWAIWTASLTNVERFYINLEKPSKYNGISLCSHFRLSSADSNTEHFRWSTSSGIQKQFVIFIDKSKATTVAELKTWLQSNPITVEYELTTEEIVPYTEAQQEAWDKIESMKLYDGVNHIESTSEIDIKYNYIYKKPSIKNKSNIENKISSGEYQTIINNKRYFVFLEEELKSVRNDITDRLYIDTNKNIAKVMKRVDKLVLNGTEEWNVNTTHSNVLYTAKPKNMADNETNIFCTITDEFSKDLSGETYGILIDTNINIKIPKVKTVADLKAYLAKEPITIQYKAIEEIKDIILLSKSSSYWTTCEDEFKYPQMQKTTNKRGCVADVIGEEIDVFCKTNKEQFEKIATHKNATGYAVNRIKKKKWKSIQLKFSSNKSFELFSCTLESYIGSYIKR